MENLILTKVETKVLFNLIGLAKLPVGIKDFPDVSSEQYSEIVEKFRSRRYIDISDNHIRINKELEEYLLPFMRANSFLLINYGCQGTLLFSSSIYFSGNGAAALIETEKNIIHFIPLDSVEEVLTFLPDVDDYEGSDSNLFVSYVVVSNNTSVFHFAAIDFKKNFVAVREEKRSMKNSPIKAIHEFDIPLYRQLLMEKMEAVFDASRN